MALPQFATYINPLLRALKSLGASARPSEVCDIIATDLTLPDSVLEERLKSGASRFENQVHWARLYLVRSGYLSSSRHGVWSLTEKGNNSGELGEGHIREIINTVIASVRSAKASSPVATTPADVSSDESGDVEEPESFGGDHRELLLAVLNSLPPEGFERLCQRVLREAGFEQVRVTGRTGDGGIDGYGVVQVNPFVSFRVLFQCKRYSGTVGAPVVRDFRGAMMGRADKGIVLTTGTFSAEARREAVRDGVPPIELVDGNKLIQMFEHLELGLKPRTMFDIDPDFFRDFQD